MSAGREERDVLPLQLDDPLEVRTERGEIGMGPGLGPCVLGRRHDAGVFRDERGRNFRGLVEIPAGHGDNPGVVSVGVGCVRCHFGGCQCIGDASGRELLVRQAPQRRGHFGVHGRASRRHVDALVPLDQIGGVTQIDRLADEPVQVFDRLGRFGQRRY